MKKAELRVQCLYAENGETAEAIILRSFVLFLQRELTPPGEVPLTFDLRGLP